MNDPIFLDVALSAGSTFQFRYYLADGHSRQIRQQHVGHLYRAGMPTLTIEINRVIWNGTQARAVTVELGLAHMASVQF